MRIGIEAALRSCNQNGGIAGRSVELIALDDGYRRDLAWANMRRLLLEDHVQATIGNVGTPTARETVPLANRFETVMFGALTGASLVRRDPPDRYVWNYRASYIQEVRELIRGLLGIGIRPFEFAFFTQRDGYGDAVYSAALDELHRRGHPREEPLLHGRYPRNTLDLNEAVLTFATANAPPRVILLGGTFLPCAKFIRIVKPVLPNTIFVSVSFIGSSALIDTLGQDAEGVVITQTVPSFDSEMPIVADLRHALLSDLSSTEPNQIILEGYVAARLLLEVLERAPRPLNRESIVRSLESLGPVDLGLGAELRLDTRRHQACEAVWPTIVRDGKVVALDWTELG